MDVTSTPEFQREYEDKPGRMEVQAKDGNTYLVLDDTFIALLYPRARPVGRRLKEAWNREVAYVCSKCRGATKSVIVEADGTFSCSDGCRQTRIVEFFRRMPDPEDAVRDLLALASTIDILSRDPIPGSVDWNKLGEKARAALVLAGRGRKE